MLQSVGWQRAGHALAAEQQQQHIFTNINTLKSRLPRNFIFK